MAIKKITRRDDYNSDHNCTWCPGCGNYAIWYMLKQAMLELAIDPHNVVIVYDIGCAGNGANFTDVYAFHGLHGRAMPVAEGIKLTNPDVKVIVMGGDGGGMGIGVGHFIHACRRNADITYILHDNQIYGLTTGQTSPRSDKGMVTKTSIEGNYEDPVNPISLALTSKATFVSRAFSGNPRHLKEILKQALQHKGFSFVDVLQPCVTFNKQNTYAWYDSKVYDLQSEVSYSATDFSKALGKSIEWGGKIPMGVFYQEQKQTLEEHYNLRHQLLPGENRPAIDVTDLLQKFKV